MSPDSDGAQSTLATWIRERLEHTLAQPVRDWIRPDTGLSAAARFSVTLADGSRVFVKAATDDQTERWLRTEYLALQDVPARFVPSVVAWIDEPGCHPILVVEDLLGAHWPASHDGVDWRHGDIDRVLAAVADLSGLRAPDGFAPSARHREARWPAFVGEGPALAAQGPDDMAEGPDHGAFLGLGLCSAAWLTYASPLLVAAEASLDESGERMVHGDLRSDNICLDGDRVVFVDWSHASRGHAEHDLAGLLPTLHLEGGPAPYDVLPDGGGWAAAGCALLVRRVLDERTLPPWLAKVLVRLAAIDLAWAASCLGLPPPDGLDWRAI